MRRFLTIFSLILPIVMTVFGYAYAQGIHEAVYEADLQKVNQVLASDPNQLETKNENGLTPLQAAASIGSHDIMRLLLKQGADPNARDNNDRTALFFTAGRGDLEACRLLVSEGAEVDVKNRYHRTPLLYGVWSGRQEVVDFFIDKRVNVNLRDTEGLAPLHHACAQGIDAAAEALIRGGADLSIKDKGGRTPLHTAANHGRSRILAFMLEKDTDPRQLDNSGDTPLHGAAWSGSVEAVSDLLEAGADLDAKNLDGQTPLAYAELAGRRDVVALFKERGANGGVAGKHAGRKDRNQRRSRMKEHGDVTMTVLYDNYACTEGTRTEWGFSCLIEGTEKTILFDTGGNGEALLENVDRLGADLNGIDAVVISHNHWDHTGGLESVLKMKPGLPVYFLHSFPYEFVRTVEGAKGRAVPVDEPCEVCPHVTLTGEMGDQIKEQSLILDTGFGVVVVTGCSHQGIVNILKKTKDLFDERILLVFGGFHLMRHSDAQMNEIIKAFHDLGVEKCGATHCTGDHQIAMFREAYGENYVSIGTGRIIRVTDAGLVFDQVK